MYIKMHIFDNPDKDSWYDDDSNSKGILYGSRILIAGAPHSGKSQLLKHLLINSDNYSEIFIKTIDPESKEYDDLLFTRLDNFSDLNNINMKNYDNRRCMIILEDCNNIPTSSCPVVHKFLSFYASHCGWSICILSQTPYQLPVNLRRLIDTFIIFGNGDLRFLTSVPISAPRKKIIQNLIETKAGKHDFVKIDIPRNEFHFNFSKLDI